MLLLNAATFAELRTRDLRRAAERAAEARRLLAGAHEIRVAGDRPARRLSLASRPEVMTPDVA